MNDSLLSSYNPNQLSTVTANTGGDAQQLTDAGFAAIVRLVTNVANAAVASSQVLAYAVLTDIWVQGALVDVWRGGGIPSIEKQSLIRQNVHMLLTLTSAICCNANAAAAHSLELGWNKRRFSSNEDELIRLSIIYCNMKFKGGFYQSSWKGRGSKALRSRAQD